MNQNGSYSRNDLSQTKDETYVINLDESIRNYLIALHVINQPLLTAFELNIFRKKLKNL